jgi:hypothetical protein
MANTRVERQTPPAVLTILAAEVVHYRGPMLQFRSESRSCHPITESGPQQPCHGMTRAQVVTLKSIEERGHRSVVPP